MKNNKKKVVKEEANNYLESQNEENEKEWYSFDFKFFYGAPCSGWTVDNASINIELSDEEVAHIRELVRQCDEESLKRGLMPLLKQNDIELFTRFALTARTEMYDYYARESIRDGYTEFEEEDLLRNFEADLENGLLDDYIPEDGDIDDKEVRYEVYSEWYHEEMSRIREGNLKWIRSRYNLHDEYDPAEDDTYDDCEDYTIFIPKEFM